MKKILACASLLTLTPMSYAIPLLDLEIGVKTWGASYSGDLGSTSTDIESLGLEDDNANIIHATLEFPLPILPNIRIAATDLSTSGNTTLTQSFTLNNQTYSATDTINTDFDLSHTDVTLYYGLPEFYLDIDLGVTLRVFDGEASASSTIASESVDVDFVLPMLFADVRLNLPFTGLYLATEANFLSVGDNSISDINARLGYSMGTIPFLADLEFEIGYRSIDIEIEESDLKADVKIDGPFAGIAIAF